MASIRPANVDDIDRLIELTREVAAEGIWIGTEVPFDEDLRRTRLRNTIEGPGATVLVAVTDARRSAASGGSNLAASGGTPPPAPGRLREFDDRSGGPSPGEVPQLPVGQAGDELLGATGEVAHPAARAEPHPEADDPGTVVGDISVVIAPYGVADIAMLLAEGWRGQGLGTALLRAGLAWAGDHGAHKAWLEVWPHNHAGLALYRKLGFVEEGRKVRHYRRRNGELWDSVLMGRPLPLDVTG